MKNKRYNLEDLVESVVSILKKEDYNYILVSVEDPHELERKLKNATHRKVYHFWEPSSRYGLIVIDGLGNVSWILGDKNMIIKTFKFEDVNQEFGIGNLLSSATFNNNVFRLFKEKY